MNEFMHGHWPLNIIGAHIWHGFIQGTVAMLLALAACRLFPRISPNTSSWLCRLGYLKLLVAFVFLGAISLPVSVRPQMKPPSEVISAALMNSPVHTLISSAEHPTQQQDALFVLVMAWCVGVILFGIRIGVASYKTRALRRSCSSVRDEELQSELSDLCRQMRIGRVPELLTGGVSGPLICGFVSPSIILPESTLSDSNHSDLHLILAHELAHIKRRDVMWAWLPMLAQWFFFFHPLVWILRKEWLFTQEAACDVLAVETTNASRAQYGRLLLDHASRIKQTRPLMAIGVAEQYETLKRRLNAMKSETGKGRRQLLVGVIIGVLALGGIIPWVLRAKNHSMTAKEIANILPRAAYAGDAKSFQSALSDNPVWREWETNAQEYVKDFSSKVQSYGPVLDIVPEADDRILPGLTGKGMRCDPAVENGRALSTWRVRTQRGEYRLGLVVRDGKLSAFTFNLADGGIGSGAF